MKRRWSYILIITACLLLIGMFFIKGLAGTGSSMVYAEAATPTPGPVPQSLYASYTGPTVKVGDKIDRKYLLVTVTYNTGYQEPVTDYTVSNEVITESGLNAIVILYGELTAKIYVNGKKLTGISVVPVRTDYGLGNMPDSKDLTVTGNYSDGSIELINDEFEIFPDKLENTGKNEVIVRYRDLEAKCYVYAKYWESVTAINVSYNKDEMYTNMKIDRNDITVIAVYNDMSSERVTTYTIEKEIFYDTGKQPLTITYGGVKKTIEINVKERYVTGIEAEYKGGAVVVGKKFRESDLFVYLKYVDGELVRTDDYIVHSKKIRYIGNNQINIYYGDKFSTEVIIEGVEDSKPSFEYVSEFTADNETVKVTIKTAIPKYLDKNCIVSETLENKTLKKAFRKLKIKKAEFIAFTYDFVNPNDELELPFTVRITIPQEYDMDHTFLYYTPNRKTIFGKTNKTVIDSKTFECTLFKTGTYMLVYSEELEDEEE